MTPEEISDFIERGELIKKMALGLVRENAARVAELGNFPPYMDPQRSLTGRVPQDEVTAPGFDAGIACCMDIIPRDKQRLSAILHGAYTPEAVDQVRREIVDLEPGSETAWWLAMSSICIASKEMVDSDAFEAQVGAALELAKSESLRLSAAMDGLDSLRDSYTVTAGVAYGDTDGCIQAAYLDGIDLGVYRHDGYGLWFIGTLHPSLGLEDFEWSTDVDDQGRAKSGAISSQFVKASSLSELRKAVEIAKRHLSI